MKRNKIFAGLIFAILSLGMLLVTCSLAGDMDDLRAKAGGGTFTLTVNTIEELTELLPVQKGGKSAARAGKLIVTFDLGDMADPNDNWQKLLGAIGAAGKYVELDLSACEMNGTSFSPNNSASSGKDRIVSIVLPDKATSITAGGNEALSAFKDFTNINSAAGSYISDIGDYAFWNLINLSVVNFPNTTTIGDLAFFGCINLSVIDFKNAITIGNNAFFDCKKLPGIYLPAAENIGTSAFGSSGIANANLPSVKLISSSAFSYCINMTVASFPNDAEIQYNPFEACSSLKTFNLLPGTGTGNKQLNIYTGHNAHGLYRGEFGDDAELLSWPAISDWCNGNGIISIANGALLANFNLKVFYSDTVTDVRNMAFEGCINLSDVILPNAITIGNTAFSSCTSLTSVDFAKVEYIRNNVFIGTGGVPLEIKMGAAPPNVAHDIFYDVDIPKTVTIKVPSGSSGSYDATWQDAFTGGNPNITLIIVEE